jgi:asparagine synthetase B (glutamine-hydrolysing)
MNFAGVFDPCGRLDVRAVERMLEHGRGSRRPARVVRRERFIIGDDGRVGAEPALELAASDGGGDLVGFVGRLHNREELCRRLGGLAPSVPDQDVVSRAVIEWGRDAIERLRGRFVAVWWQQAAQTLLIARDPTGLIPCYYHHAGSSLVFASSVASLVGLPHVPRDLDPVPLRDYFIRRTDPHRSFLSSVRRLAPGYLVEVSADRVRLARHYTPAPRPLPRGSRLADYAEALRACMDRAVARETIGGRTIGLQLSGGLDSAGLACLAGRQLQRSGRQLHAASIVLPPGSTGPATDEGVFVDALADVVPNMVVERLTPQETGPFDGLDDWFERVWAPAHVYHFADRALLSAFGRAGVDVVLSGVGGDSGASWGRADPGRHRDSPWRALKRRLSPLANPLAAMVSGRVHPHVERLRFGIGLRIEEQIRRHALAGLDFVLPYRDLDVLELVAGIPVAMFQSRSSDRQVFRQAMRDVLPDLILRRQDKGTYVPDFPRRLSAWLPELSRWMRDIRQTPNVSALVASYVDQDAFERALSEFSASPGWQRGPGPLRVILETLTLAPFLLWYGRNEGKPS